jgi:hypothetical protein
MVVDSTLVNVEVKTGDSWSLDKGQQDEKHECELKTHHAFSLEVRGHYGRP